MHRYCNHNAGNDPGWMRNVKNLLQMSIVNEGTSEHYHFRDPLQISNTSYMFRLFQNKFNGI